MAKVPPDIVKAPSTSSAVWAVSVPALLIVKLKKLLEAAVFILEPTPLNVMVPAAEAPDWNVPLTSFQSPTTSWLSDVPAVNTPPFIKKLPSKSITLFCVPTFVISNVPLVIVKFPSTSKGEWVTFLRPDPSISKLL